LVQDVVRIEGECCAPAHGISCVSRRRSTRDTDCSGSTDTQLSGAVRRAGSAGRCCRKAKAEAHHAAFRPRETTINADDTRPTDRADTLPNTALPPKRYLEIARAGGWPSAPKEGAKGPAVAILRRRVAISGKYEGMRGADIFEGAMTAAVKRFQFRHGLRQSGIVAGHRLDEMNVPAQTRVRQLA
jgi:hypothetical protein